MPRGKRRIPPEQSFLGQQTLDEIAEAATPQEYKEKTEVIDEPTIGDLAGSAGHVVPGQIAPHPNILVSDAPFPGQTPDPSDTFIPLGQAATAVVAAVQQAAAREGPPPVPTPGPQGTGRVTYKQRVQIMEVYRYPGHFRDAPPWVDRNWLSYFPYSEATPQRPAGPGLNIPGVGAVYVGDFLVQQEVSLDEGLSDVRLAVYTPDEFFRWFIPSRGGDGA
jgi:hypothetical protein